jgi:hypothetical protein
MVKLFEEEIHIMQLFYVNQSIRNVRDVSNATHDRPIPSIGTIFNIISKSLVFGIVGCIATHNALIMGNKYGPGSELKKCPGMPAHTQAVNFVPAYVNSKHFANDSSSVIFIYILCVFYLYIGCVKKDGQAF